MKIFCTLPFDKEVWDEMNDEMDELGKIYLKNDLIQIQVIPVQEFHFMPGGEQVIEIIVEIASDMIKKIGISVFEKWIWNKLEKRENKKIQINEKNFNIQNEDELIDIIKSNCNTDKEDEK